MEQDEIIKNDNQIITLSGFGELSELDSDGNNSDYDDLAKYAEQLNCEFYATYYDHELKGTVKAIESITVAMWSMPRDEWIENNLFAIVVE